MYCLYNYNCEKKGGKQIMNLFHPIYMYALYAAICCCDHVQMQKPLWGNRLLKILHSVFQLLKQFILMQRTKSTLRNIAGHLCGT